MTNPVTGYTVTGADAKFIDGTELATDLAPYAKTADLAAVATTGSYTDLSNQPSIPAAQVQTDWNATTGLASIANKPALFSGAYADLTGKPTLFSGSYTDLTNKPTLFSGAYTDLTGKPTLGTAAAQDVSAFATAAQGAKADTAVQLSDLSTVATTGNYSDLAGKPTLGSAASQDTTAFRASTWTPAVADLPAGSTLTVLSASGAWPARPTARTDVFVRWVDAAALGTQPSGAVNGDELIAASS